MCQFAKNVDTMNFTNCNLFQRSFTNKGIGFTFNSEREETLIKKSFRSKVLFPNTKREPALMKSASIDDSLRVVIENNADEIQRYENSKDKNIPGHPGTLNYKPKTISINIHNPKEIADIRSKSFL